MFYVTALEWSTFTYGLVLGNLHTNNCKNEINGTCIHLTVNPLIWVKMFTFIWTRVRKKKYHQTLHQKNVLWLWQFYKYFKAESEERHQSVAGIKCLKEYCQITDLCIFSMYSCVNWLHFSILHFWVYTIFEQYRYATVIYRKSHYIKIVYSPLLRLKFL